MVIRTVLAACAAALALSAAPAPAFAEFGFDGTPTVSLSTTQAGGHPDLTTSFTLNRRPDGYPDGNLKDAVFDLPPGIVGDPTAFPKCSLAQLHSNACPDGAQIGQVTVTLIGPTGNETTQTFPLWNMVPRRDFPAEFISPVLNQDIFFVVSVRSDGDYGIRTTITDAQEAFPIVSTTVTLWGVPTDNNGSGLPRAAFLTNSANCGTQDTATLRVNSWQDPDRFAGVTLPLGPMTGCDSLPSLDPTVEISPTTTVAGAPSGYDISLTVAQVTNPNSPFTPSVKDASVVLPEGTAMSPSAADGLEACTNAQAGFGSLGDPACPDRSKIGSLTITTPLLEDQLLGTVYLGEPLPGNRYRLLMVAKGSGVIVKLQGRVSPDPVTGQLTTTFLDNPQLPFSRLDVHLDGGPRGVLVNPIDCGMKAASATLTPYGGGEPETASTAFPISWDGNGASCPGLSFSPQLVAGVANPIAGARTPFVFHLVREDRHQELSQITAELPPGLLGKVAGVPLCPDDQAAAGSCAAESRIGGTSVAAGPGTNPFWLGGTVYLTGPYKGAPYGLSIVVPAIAGPFDLGLVVVRAAVFVDRTTAAIRVVSDPLPTILEGVPLKLRNIRVAIDRPDFMVAPTNCSPMEVRAVVQSLQGATATTSSRFQVGECAALPFRPRMAMRLTGRNQTTDGRHPGLRAVVTQGSGQANLGKAAVKLPLSLALDPENAQSDALCEFEAGQRVDCPPSSIIGQATAVTPLLNRPLTGPVHFVKNVRRHPRTGNLIRTLPTLLIPLRGELAIDLRATTSVSRGKLVTTFPTIPDAPISRFELTLQGGSRGILVVTGNRNICRGPQIADVEMDGQNGKRADPAVRMRTPCRSPNLRVRKASWRGPGLTVRGSLRRAAIGPVTVTARCGTARATERVRTRRGRWAARLNLRGRCAESRVAKVTARYAGGPGTRGGRATRRVRAGR
jgi:hypothetical protein